jgi:hypothetical protein
MRPRRGSGDTPLPGPPPCEAHATLQYRRDSRLLVVRSGGAQAKAGASTVLTYYTVEGEAAKLRLLSSRSTAEPAGGRCALSAHASLTH